MKYIVKKLLNLLLLALGISFLLFWYGILYSDWYDDQFMNLENNSTYPIPKHELIQIFRTGMFWTSLSIVILLVVIALQIVLSKWRPVRVYLSYQLKDISLANDLSNALHRQGVQARFCYFDSPDHDNVLAAVQSGIRACDTLLVLPGTEPSFIDAEILAAAVARKAVVIIDRESDTLPNTAYEGYPVFVLAKLQKEDFKPLVSFLNFVHGRLASVDMIITESMWIISLSLVIMFWIPIAILICVFVVSALLAFLGIAAVFKIFMYLSMIELPFWAGVLLLSIVWANSKRLRAARIVRQSIITRTATYEELRDYLPIFFEDTHSYLKDSPLKKRHI